jgi:hypothetical protein
MDNHVPPRKIPKKMSTSEATGTSNRRRSGGGGQGSRNRNNNRNRSGGRPNRRPAKAPEPSFGQKFLKVITFGLAGGSPAKPAPTRERNRDRDRSTGSGGGRNRNDDNRGSESSSRRRSDDRSTRSPEIVEVTNTRLYVGNLSYDATESDLFELFTGAGAVQNAEVVSHKYSERSKGYAFVEMATIDEAKRAVDVLHDQDFMGRKLVVSGAKSRGPHESTASE